ncbi:MAG: tetratricopeptide repeat protein [Alphaproteobacteria bacterium]|nr:tetratricopeptide repeat protein [Alphaproteobacteria bacterium]
MGDLTYPSAIAPYTFREGYDYKKYLENQSHFDNLATDIDQSIAKLALSNAEVARLSTEAVVESQREAANQISQGLDSIRVGIERLDDSIIDLRQSVDDVRWSIDEVRYSIESGFQLTAQRLRVIEGVLRDLLEAVKSPEKTWALEKYDIAKDLYRRELYEDALSYLNDALHGHGDHRGYIFDPRVHMLKGNILLGDGENFEPELIDFNAAKKCFDEAVKYAKPPRDMLIGTDETRQEEFFQPRVFARCSSAWASYVQGHISEAESEYREAVKEGPNDARAHYYLGKVLAHQGRFDEAESHLDKAIRINFYYVAKLATDQDYLKDRKRFENRVAEYRAELLKRLKPFADVLCLLKGKKPEGLYSGNWKYDNIRTLDLSQSIAGQDAEIGPMVSNYDQLKRDAVQAGDIIEEVANQSDFLVSSAKNQKGYISKPSDSSIGYFNSDSIAGKQRTIGWAAAGGLALLGILTGSGGPFSLAVFAAGYALLGAPLIASIAESDHKNKERRRLDSEYRNKLSKADQEISQASQKSKEANDLLFQYRQIAPNLSTATG